MMPTVAAAAPTGIPQRSGAARGRAAGIEAAATATPGIGGAAAVAGVAAGRRFGRGPLARTRIAAPSNATSTVPSVSVR